jgi:fibronectin type 3 domain-containing protein
MPTGTGDGAFGAYYHDQPYQHFIGAPLVTRIDRTINFDWHSASPDPVLGPADYSVRWTGKLRADYSETYTFYTISDDGVRLYVNGQLIINNWSLHGTMEDSGSITLSAGQLYDFVMEYFQYGSDGEARLSWQSPSTAKQIIPQANLFSGQAPVAPTNLSAVAVSGTQINLVWSDNSNNETGFSIERKSGVNGTYGIIAAVQADSAAYSDTALSPGTSYFYRVQATNFLSNSTYSSEASALTPVPPQAPTAGFAGNNTPTSIRLAWQDNALNEDGYRITRQAQGESAIALVADLPPDTTSFDDTGLDTGTEYQYRILAYNIGGESTFAVVNTATLTLPPGDLTATANPAAVMLNWVAPYYRGNPANFTFRIYRGDTSQSPSPLPIAVNIPGTSYTDTTALPGRLYYYWVSADDVGGQSASSTEASATAHHSFATWQRLYFSEAQIDATEISGPLADPSKQGITNLAAYAFNLSPFNPTASGQLPATLIVNNRLTIQFVRRRAVTDVNYTVEVSDDLLTWQSGGAHVTEVDAAPIDGLTELVRVSDNTPFTQGVSRRFIRVRLSF